MASPHQLLFYTVFLFVCLGIAAGAPKKDKTKHQGLKRPIGVPKLKLNLNGPGIGVPTTPSIVGAVLKRTGLAGGRTTCEGGPSEPPSSGYPPLFLVEASDGEYRRLWPSESGNITRKTDTRMIVSCPGTRVTDNRHYQSARVRCLSSGKWKMTNTGEEKAFDGLSCLSPVNASTEWVDKKCKNGTYLNFGYKAMGDFISAFYACHDAELGASRYAHHKLFGVLLNYQKDSNETGDWKTGLSSLYKGYDVEKAHTQDNFKKVLEETYGEENATLYLKNCTSENCILPLQLAPSNDFFYTIDRNATHFWANTVPSWSSIAKGNWGKLESNIRDYAKKANKTLKIYTGAKDVLKLPDENSGSELYLAKADSNRHLPVPAFIWKILIEEGTNSCIGFVTVNNPFSSGSHEKVCEDVCEKHGWPSYKNYTEGQTYCCEAEPLSSFLQFNLGNCTQPLKHG